MQHRTLGKTGWKVSAIGFGAWGIGGQWGPVEQRAGIDSIKAAYDAGVNFFDTADAYGEPVGTSEEWIGHALRPVRDRVLIATKVGNFARRQQHPLLYTHPLHVELCCDASLRRLGIDVIDLYQCHIGDLKDPAVFLEAFDGLVKKGKIRAYGISTNSVDVVTAFDRDGNCATVQTDYSMLNRTPEKEILPLCQARNIGVIVRGPLAMGVLAGKFSATTNFTDQVRSSWNAGPGRERFLKRIETVGKLRFLQNDGRTLAQAALQFVISHPAVSVAIPGAKDPNQARSNSAAGDATIAPAEMERINHATGI